MVSEDILKRSSETTVIIKENTYILHLNFQTLNIKLTRGEKKQFDSNKV